MSVTKKPKLPVNHTKRRKTATVLPSFCSFPELAAEATFLTAEVPNPKLVIPEIKPIELVNIETIPIPAGPRKIAIILLRKTAITILKT